MIVVNGFPSVTDISIVRNTSISPQTEVYADKSLLAKYIRKNNFIVKLLLLHYNFLETYEML